MDLFDAVSRSSIPWLPGFLVAFSNAASFTIAASLRKKPLAPRIAPQQVEQKSSECRSLLSEKCLKYLW